MSLQSIVISVIMFSAIMLGLSTYYGNIVSVYNPPNMTTSETFQSFNQTFNKTAELMKSFENHTTGFTQKGITDPSKYSDALMAFLDIGGVILQTPNMIMNSINSAFNLVPMIPDWFRYMVYSIITVTIGFIVVSIFLKRDTI